MYSGGGGGTIFQNPRKTLIKYMDDIEICAKKGNELGMIQTIRIYSQYIGMEFDIKMCYSDNEK